MSFSKELIVNHEVGLHARPAAQFVKTASRYSCDIQLENVTRGSETVNAKSIMSVLTCGVEQGHRIRLTADGEDAKVALAALTELIESNFAVSD
jgi:phosphotransferase system HPr (HPr) family protein